MAFAQWVDAVFAVVVAALVPLHVFAYAAPAALVPFNALPWAFRVDFNTDLDFQTVTYATVHESAPARLSHVTLPVEVFAWAAILFAWHPAALAACTVLVGVVFARMPERPFSFYAFATWLVVAAAAVAVVHTGAWSSLETPAKILLVVAPAVRVLGHTFDPIPPFVGGQGDAFVPYRDARIGWRTPFVLFAGWISECAAALPFRLVWVQLFWGMQLAGYRPRVDRRWAEASEVAARIRREGWKAYPKTQVLFEGMDRRA